MRDRWANIHTMFPKTTFFGGSDVLLLQFGDVNTITGKVFLDHNANGAQDPGETLMSDIKGRQQQTQ